LWRRLNQGTTIRMRFIRAIADDIIALMANAEYMEALAALG
jgi:hypothetical protein